MPVAEKNNSILEGVLSIVPSRLKTAIDISAAEPTWAEDNPGPLATTREMSAGGLTVNKQC